jgi:archaemetzincin
MFALIFWDSTAPGGIELPVLRTITAILGIPAKVTGSCILLDGFVGARKQIDAKAVLDSMEIYTHRTGFSHPLLLVIGQDLFRAGTLSLFGLARPETGVAVISTARLSNEFYGRYQNDEEFINRISREGAHEIGHLFGLGHCSDPECVMFNPCTFDELDRKRNQFCQSCKRAIESAIAQS